MFPNRYFTNRFYTKRYWPGIVNKSIIATTKVCIKIKSKILTAFAREKQINRFIDELQKR